MERGGKASLMMRAYHDSVSGANGKSVPPPMLSAARVKPYVSLLEYVEIALNVRLRRRGRNFWALCPFHRETHASFSVRPDLGLFYCFGCRVGGDVFTFEMLRSHCTFPEAIRRVALFAGLNPQSPSLLWRLGEQVISRVEGPRVRKFFASPPKVGERRRRSRLPAGAARARMIGKRKLACLLPRRIVPVTNLPPVSCAADAADCESRGGGAFIYTPKNNSRSEGVYS
jgi:hypothetical protein